MIAIKTGPLTREELMTLWQSVTDSEYHKPLLEKDDSNVEIIEQMAEQFSRVSQSVDVNTQGMFILPWSGQTAPPASGESNARVTLQLTRTSNFDVALFLQPGEVIIQHRLNDYSADGPVETTTNRLYTVETGTALGPGQAGPIDLPVIALRPGAGYNFPTPDTLRTILQPGVGFNNFGATVVNGTGSTNRVIATTFPDVPITEHIGQYLLFTAGANAGQYRRIVGIENPDPSVPHGGVFNLAAEVIFSVSGTTGTFTVGERVSQPASGAYGQFISLYNGQLVLLKNAGTFTATDPLVGELGGTATPTSKRQVEDLVPETSGASWRVVSWGVDLGVGITNLEQPTGGRCGFLDELGNERGLPRLPGEDDDAYRQRIAQPADVVTPGAVIRAGNSVVEPFGEEVCLREVGRPLFQGMFYDGGPNQAPFAFDLDLVEMTVADGSGFIPGEAVSSVDVNGIITAGNAQHGYTLNSDARPFRGVVNTRGPGFQPGRVLRGHVSGWTQVMSMVGPGLLPHHRFNTYLNLRQFRGYFIVGVPRIVGQDFGIFYDAGPDNAYDTNVVGNFYDGRELGTGSLYSRVWNAVNGVRPAGVPFDLYLETIGCI